MTVAWIVLIVVLIAFYFAHIQRKKLLDSGQIIKRRAGFVEYAEIFTIKEMPFSDIAAALRGANYYGKANLSFNSEREAVGFGGAGWAAHLYHMNDDILRNAYCFEFTKWEMRDWMILEGIAMNIVLTTVEKTFLQLDPNTQVSSRKMEIKSRPNFF